MGGGRYNWNGVTEKTLEIPITITPDGFKEYTTTVQADGFSGSLERSFKITQTVFTITVLDTTNGTVTASTYKSVCDEEIELTTTCDKGYHLSTCKVQNSEITGNTFIMPTENVTIQATFDINIHTITLPAISNGKMIIEYSNKSVESSEQTQEVDIPYGTTIHLQSFTTDSSYIFSSYSVGGNTQTKNYFTMPDESLTLSANFINTGHSITYTTTKCTATGVTTSGAGNTVKVSVEINSGYVISYASVNNNAVAHTLAGSGQNYTLSFVMPSEDATVKINCVSSGSVTLSGVNDYNALDKIAEDGDKKQNKVSVDEAVKNLDNPNYYPCLDWKHFGEGDTKKTKNKSLIGDISSSTTDTSTFVDYSCILSWTDGTNGTNSLTGSSRKGKYTTGTFSVPIYVHNGVKRIRFYGGTWDGTEKVYLTNSDGTTIGSSVTITVSGDSYDGERNARFVEFIINCPISETIYLKAERTSTTGNVQFVAVAVYGTDEWVQSQDYTDNTYVNLDDNLYNTKALYWERYISTTETEVGGVDKNSFSDSVKKIATNDLQDFPDYKWNVYGATGGLEKDNSEQKHGICGTQLKYTITVPANVTAIKVFTGGWQSTNHLSLIAENGFVTMGECFTSGNGSGNGWARYSVFSLKETSSSRTYTLYMSSLINSGQEAHNVSLVAIVLYGVESTVTISAETAPTAYSPDNIANVLDWQHTKTNDNKYSSEKLNAQKYILYNNLSGVVYSGNNSFNNYATTFTYTNYTGTQITSSDGVHNNTDDITLAIKVDSTVKQISLFAGAWDGGSANLKARLSVYKNGVEINGYDFNGASPSNAQLITIGVNTTEEDIFYVKLHVTSFEEGQSCNISIPMVIVLG